MLVVVLAAGLTLVIALLIVIVLRLMALPATLAALVRKERTEGRTEGMQVLQEQGALAVGPITPSLRRLEEETAARHRVEVAAAEARARRAERQASEGVPLLTARAPCSWST